MPENSSEGPKQLVEIRHGSTHDLILNRRAQDQVLVDNLARLVSDGFPNDWHPYIPPSGRNTRNPLFVNDPNRPQFIAKKRYFTGQNQKRFHSLGGSMKRLNSIINEISVSASVKDALESEDAIRLAEESGLHPITYVEPLVGLIDRATGEKSLIYPFVQGDSSPDTLRSFEETANRLKRVFEVQGIDPWDFAKEQFIVAQEEGKPRLYVVDAEGFTRKSST